MADNERVRSPLSTPPAIPAGALAASPQPVLTTPGGLVLRLWEPSDAAVFFAAYRDPAIRHWHTRQPASESQVRDWFEQYRQQWAQEEGASWAVTRGGDDVLGRIALGSLNLDDGVAGAATGCSPRPAARASLPAH